MPEPLTTATHASIGELAGEVSAAAVVALRKAWQAGRDAGATEMCATATMIHLAHEKPIRDAAKGVLAAYQRLLDNDDLDGLRDALTELQESLNPVPTGEQISPRDVARMRRALEWIGPVCSNFTSSSCRDDPWRSPDAKYGADRWCDGCIASFGLDVNPDRGAADV